MTRAGIALRMFLGFLRRRLAEVFAPVARVGDVAQAEHPLSLGKVAKHFLHRVVPLLRQGLEEVDHLGRRLVLGGGLDDLLARRGIFDPRGVPGRAPGRVLSDSSRHGVMGNPRLAVLHATVRYVPTADPTPDVHCRTTAGAVGPRAYPCPLFTHPPPVHTLPDQGGQYDYAARRTHAAA